jgi:uncharacterized protein (TIGR02145 family)
MGFFFDLCFRFSYFYETTVDPKYLKMKNAVSSLIVISGTLIFIFYGCNKKEDEPANVSDIEGNSYKTVTIGAHIWMAENLKTTKYNDGTDIPLIEDAATWHGLTSGGLCWYNNSSEQKSTYGALYNGYTVTSGKLCPVNWHIPSLEELKELREYSGDTIAAGGTMKETGTEHWFNPNYGADNKSGFSARGSGIRYFEGTYSSLLYFTGFWSSTEIQTDEQWYISFYYNDARARLSYQTKKSGFSVRCVKDK